MTNNQSKVEIIRAVLQEVDFELGYEVVIGVHVCVHVPVCVYNVVPRKNLRASDQRPRVRQAGISNGEKIPLNTPKPLIVCTLYLPPSPVVSFLTGAKTSSRLVHSFHSAVKVYAVNVWLQLMLSWMSASPFPIPL